MSSSPKIAQPTPHLTHAMLPLQIVHLKNADYQTTHEAMLGRTLARIDAKKNGRVTADELWVVDHNDVYTLGQAGKEEHILARSNTPVIKTDRGGQVTWHGHGQLVVYFLFDLNTLGWGVRDLVSYAEQAIVDTVMQFAAPSVTAKARHDAPGVYLYNNQSVELGKIASLGFKIKHGFSYHGIALNVNNDLTAFNLINPCGYAGMQMLRLADFFKDNDPISIKAVTTVLIERIQHYRQLDQAAV